MGRLPAWASMRLPPSNAYLNLGTAVVAGIYGLQYKTSKAFRR